MGDGKISNIGKGRKGMRKWMLHGIVTKAREVGRLWHWCLRSEMGTGMKQLPDLTFPRNALLMVQSSSDCNKS